MSFLTKTFEVDNQDANIYLENIITENSLEELNVIENWLPQNLKVSRLATIEYSTQERQKVYVAGIMLNEDESVIFSSSPDFKKFIICKKNAINYLNFQEAVS